MASSMTVNVTCTVEARSLRRNQIAYWLALIHSTCNSTYNLNSKLPTQTHQLHHIATSTAFSSTVTLHGF